MQNFLKLNIKKAFTLAEVLITLVIIGVVAALTIPTAVAYYNREQTASQLKKFYSTMSQAINRSVVDNGHYTSWDFTQSEDSQRTIDFVDKYIFPYLQIVKKCTPTSNECWPDDVRTATNNGIYSQYSNSKATHSSAVLADGSCVYFWVGGNSSHSYVAVDLNGLKGPNTVGRDIFVFILRFFDGTGTDVQRVGFFPPALSYKELPTRSQLLQTCGNSDAQDCSSLIMFDGWHIKSDYPYRI